MNFIPSVDAETPQTLAKAIHDARNSPKLAMPVVVVYRRPRDAPDDFVMRLFVGEEATNLVFRASEPGLLRAVLEVIGLVRLIRHEADDPVIVETWI